MATMDELEIKLVDLQAQIDKLSLDNLMVVQALATQVVGLAGEVEVLKKRNHALPTPPRQPRAKADPWRDLKRGLGIE